MTQPRSPLFELDDIHVSFATPDGPVEAVRGVSMQIARGETVAVVGESGSGKSQAMMAAMGLLAGNGQVTGAARFNGDNLIGQSKRALDRIRGAKITMIFQEPMTSLDPLYTIERQIAEPLMVHGGLSRRKARARALDLLELVRIPNAKARLGAYPHELSGGQRQRVMIAMALANDPDLLIADEPTTALDVTIQAEILGLLADLQTRLGMAILFITHDLGIVQALADRVYVMRHGVVVEHGPTDRIFAAPETAYTTMLLDSEPTGRKAPVAPEAETVMDARGVTVTFTTPAGFLSRPSAPIHAVRAVNLSLRRGETLGVVGESGSGKSTLGRAVLQLLPSEGRVSFLGTSISGLDRSAMRPYRKSLQMVFQDPYGSLSPRMTVGEIITEGLLVHAPELSAKDRDARARAALQEVDLDPAVRNRFPHEFSGGQRQRIAIARALVLHPTLIVLDEPTSALDRSVQKQIVTLLRDLQIRHAMSYIFISHDLAVVRALADHVMVMRDGTVVEAGSTAQIFDDPTSNYTRRLMRAAFDLSTVLSEQSVART
ncbi:ABC transporter ATP-binding protein [Pseudoruegeria sp. SK021]|uniref:ABC transporter ATP-binding protein n=1 Tax=Pseudoruegeria sp. SK021 TaxID=1933035 RepID=UPI000A235019|nr:ABC transporter ATP-binding protein [Pseudoruegeria sp. SK021]OSP53888.1 microcin ABC transporter ATP-binding protein [Pseudoruegeria sp. SK021]